MTELSLKSTILMSSGHRIPIFGVGAIPVKTRGGRIKAIETAIEHGIRHFDLSPANKTEEIVGEVLQKFLGSGKVRREDLFICTKLPWNGMRPESVEYFCKKSLEALHLNYLDLYLVHFPVAFKRLSNEPYSAMKGDAFAEPEYVDLDDNWKAMESLVETGLVKSIGLANYNARQVQRVYKYAAKIKPAVLQVECHPYLSQVVLFELCQKLNITFSAYSPFGVPAEMRYFFTNPELPESFEKFHPNCPNLLDDPKLHPIAQKHKKTIKQVILRFAVQRGMVVLPMFACPYEFPEYREIFDFELDEKDVEILHSLNANIRYMWFILREGIEKQLEYPWEYTPQHSVRNMECEQQ